MFCHIHLILLLVVVVVNVEGEKLIKRNIDVINNVFRKNLLNLISISTLYINGKTSVAASPSQASPSQSPTSSIPAASILNDIQYKKSLFNIPPAEFFFPTWVAGEWDTNYIFDGAGFTNKIDFKNLSKDINVAGFRRYSVAFMPDIGNNVNTKMRFIIRNNKVVEDIEYNLKSLIEAQLKNENCKVHDFVYEPTGNPNRIGFKYDDNKGNGQIEIFVNDRKMFREDNSYKCFTALRQSSVRRREDLISSNGGLKFAASQILCDYAIESTLNYSKNDDRIEGIFRIFSYLQPQDALYFTVPEFPVSFFQYKINMTRTI
jgi:hypothetical protein